MDRPDSARMPPVQTTPGQPGTSEQTLPSDASHESPVTRRPHTVAHLEVFQLAHQLVLRTYHLTRGFPREEQFGLVAQLRRAAASIPANLSEGAARHSRSEFRQFVGIARGSTAEVSYHLMLSRDLGYIDARAYFAVHRDYQRVGRMLTKLSRALKS